MSATRQLRWEDVDWTRKTIRWAAGSDKRRKEWIVPLTEELLGELRAFSVLLGATSGWMMPDARDDISVNRVSPEPIDRHTLSRMLETAKSDANLPKLEGGLWHPYRRAWATARKSLPVADLAAAGGWQNVQTLLTCYTRPTNDALLAVMCGGKKVRDVAVIGNSERNDES